MVLQHYPKILFQFALPRGERQTRGGVAGVVAGFNSRSRVGSDVALILGYRMIRSFNSRSRVGSDSA